MLDDNFSFKDFFRERVLPLIKKYWFSAAIVVFGLHLHAQAYMWEPFWDINDDDTSSILFTLFSEGMRQTQAVTARWLILTGILLGTGVHLGIIDRVKRSNKGE